MVGGRLGLLLAPWPGIETQRRLEEEFAAPKEVKREVEEETN